MGLEDLKDRINDTKQELDAVKGELDTVKTEVSNVKQDTALIKLHVTNHLPHLIAEVKDGLGRIETNMAAEKLALEVRIAAVEKKDTKSQGVKEFLTGMVKVCVSLATLTWASIQIINAIFK